MSKNNLNGNTDSKLPKGSGPKNNVSDSGKALDQMKDAVKEPTLAD